MGDHPERDLDGPTTIDAPPVPSQPPPRVVALPPGTVVGHYVIVEPLGRGGMGDVLLAYDTRLARRVALKILRTEIASDEARARMMREAQAMAQLSHPNVASIYDVGTHEERIYLAMEYVDGDTLGAWMKTPRSWREVIAVMLQAGHGLEAAHAAGIVHRDFKPANVLLAKDGRVCVVDFGIARALGAAEAPSPGAAPRTPVERTSLTPAPNVDRLTEEGTIVGTPGYFAPETAEQAADARSDEFSFCVTLWRCLYGAPPYPTSSLGDYVAAISNGPPPRPKNARAPAWLHAAIARGLDPDPARRFATMAELLRALETNPTRARLGRASLFVLLAAAALGALAIARHRRAALAACDAEGAAIGARWDTTARAALRDAIAAPGDPNANDRAERTTRTLDDYAAEWRREQTASCEATRVAGTQPEASHEARSACLLGAREQFDAVVELLGARDPSVQRHEVEMAKSLPPARLCNGSETEHVYAPLPREGAARAKAVEARRLLARARALRSSGPSSDGIAAAEKAAALADEAHDATTRSAALLASSALHARRFEDDAAVRDAAAALVAAERAGDDHTAGLAASQEAWLLAERFAQRDHARGWLDLARAKLARHGADEELEMDTLAAGNLIDDAAGERQAALDGYRRYRAIAARRYGATDLKVCKTIGNEGRELFALGDSDQAVSSFRATIACWEAEIGPNDESLGQAYNALGGALDVQGKLDDAVAAYRRALDLRAPLGPADGLQTVILGNLAATEVRADRLDDGERDARKAIALAEDATGYAHNVLPRALFVLGRARLARGDARGASADCGRAAEIEPGDYDALRCLGEAELALGDRAHAVAHLEASVAATKSPYVDDLPRAKLALARAIVSSDRARATSLAQEARDALAAAVSAQPWLRPLLASIDAWIAREK